MQTQGKIEQVDHEKLKHYLTGIEEKIGNFNGSYLYKTGNKVLTGNSINRTQMPSVLLAKQLGCSVGEDQLLLPTATRSLQDLKLPQTPFQITRPDEGPAFSVPSARIKHTIDSVQVFANNSEVLRNVALHDGLEDPIEQATQATSLCVAVDIDLFTEQDVAIEAQQYNYSGAKVDKGAVKIKEGDAVPRLRRSLKEDSPYVTMLSTPALNFGYGDLSAERDEFIKRGDDVKYIKEMFTTLFRTATIKDCEYIVMPAAGLGGFAGNANTYFTCLQEVAAEFPQLKIIYHPGPNREIFNKVFSGDKALPNVIAANKDLLSITQQLVDRGHRCAYHNPSDPQAVFGGKPLGEHFLSGNLLAEEMLALTSGLTLGSRKLNPKAYNNPVNLQEAYQLKILQSSVKQQWADWQSRDTSKKNHRPLYSMITDLDKTITALTRIKNSQRFSHGFLAPTQKEHESRAKYKQLSDELAGLKAQREALKQHEKVPTYKVWKAKHLINEVQKIENELKVYQTETHKLVAQLKNASTSPQEQKVTAEKLQQSINTFQKKSVEYQQQLQMVKHESAPMRSRLNPIPTRSQNYAKTAYENAEKQLKQLKSIPKAFKGELDHFRQRTNTVKRNSEKEHTKLMEKVKDISQVGPVFRKRQISENPWKNGQKPTMDDLNNQIAYFAGLVLKKQDISGELNRFHDALRNLYVSKDIHKPDKKEISSCISKIDVLIKANKLQANELDSVSSKDKGTSSSEDKPETQTTPQRPIR